MRTVCDDDSQASEIFKVCPRLVASFRRILALCLPFRSCMPIGPLVPHFYSALPDNLLFGTVPSEIGLLTQLTHLYHPRFISLLVRIFCLIVAGTSQATSSLACCHRSLSVQRLHICASYTSATHESDAPFSNLSNNFFVGGVPSSYLSAPSLTDWYCHTRSSQLLI